MTDSFDYLTGTARISVSAPEGWAALHHLPFWEQPNHADWGGSLSRVLYHEAIHFWQLLASAYLANLVAEDWRRLLRFEETGELGGQSANALAYTKAGDQPFSAQELVECWARFWDVHTRSPAQIIADEGLVVEDERALFLNGGYSNVAFDFFMRNGPDAAQYARPYRWLLDRMDGASRKAALLFPMVAHAAFGSPRPVAVFCAAVQLARESSVWNDAPSTGRINLDWLTLSPMIHQNFVEPVLRDERLPSFTSGFDAIERGPLGTHPIFREYPERCKVRGFLQMYRPVVSAESGLDPREAEALVATAMQDPGMLFALPGQPFYRRALGELVPPPTIRFSQFTWHAHRPIMRIMVEREHQSRAASEALLVGRQPQPDPIAMTYAHAAATLERRVSRFRAAEKAVGLGLPANAFERA